VSTGIPTQEGRDDAATRDRRGGVWNSPVGAVACFHTAAGPARMAHGCTAAYPGAPRVRWHAGPGGCAGFTAADEHGQLSGPHPDRHCLLADHRDGSGALHLESSRRTSIRLCSRISAPSGGTTCSSTVSAGWIAPTCAHRALGAKTTPKKHGAPQPHHTSRLMP
jgi:hypothetical protein